MLRERVDLQEKLKGFRKKELSEAEILEQVKAIYEADAQREEQILERIREGSTAGSNDLDPELLEAQDIFHLKHIKHICIEYRLRFLDSRYFKSPLPFEAIAKIKFLEKLHGTTLKGFRIMAPSKDFKLENVDDPVLFAPIGNHYYLLIHKWGNDLHPLRKLLVWPVKTLENLAIFTLVFSFLATLVFRELFFAQYRSTTEFMMLYLFTVKSVIGLLVFYGFALRKNFNTAIWRSRFF